MLDKRTVGDKKKRTLTAAEQRLVEKALPIVDVLARRVARRYRSDVDQFASVGSEAAIDAVRTFDPTLGTPFEVFAFKRVVGAMRRESVNELFGHLHVAIRKAFSADDDMAQPPSELELDEALEDSPEKARERAVSWIRKQTAGMLVASIHAELNRTLGGEAAVIAREERRRASAMLELAIQDLNEEERYFVRRFYQEGATLELLAKERTVAVRTVSRLHDRIKAKLAKALRKRGVNAMPPSERSV